MLIQIATKKRLYEKILMLYINYMLGILSKMYYVIMISITIDCFLKIPLNVKYGLYLSSKRARSVFPGLVHISKFDIFQLFGACYCL